MSEQDVNFYSGHRARLRQKFLDDKLADYERLELLLSYAVPRRDMRPLAHALIYRYGSIAKILTASYNELLLFPGVGPNIALFLKLIHQVILTGYKMTLDTKPIFHDISVLTNYCKWSLANKEVEEFHVLYLDSEFRLLQDELHSAGTYNETNVYVREILKHALILNASAVVLVHNHPTTNSSFSDADIDCTEKLNAMFKGVDIQLYDHILITNYAILSARTSGMLHD